MNKHATALAASGRANRFVRNEGRLLARTPGHKRAFKQRTRLGVKTANTKTCYQVVKKLFSVYGKKFLDQLQIKIRLPMAFVAIGHKGHGYRGRNKTNVLESAEIHMREGLERKSMIKAELRRLGMQSMELSVIDCIPSRSYQL